MPLLLRRGAIPACHGSAGASTPEHGGGGITFASSKRASAADRRPSAVGSPCTGCAAPGLSRASAGSGQTGP